MLYGAFDPKQRSLHERSDAGIDWREGVRRFRCGQDVRRSGRRAGQPHP
jgi:hypothetical protein